MAKLCGRRMHNLGRLQTDDVEKAAMGRHDMRMNECKRRKTKKMYIEENDVQENDVHRRK